MVQVDVALLFLCFLCLMIVIFISVLSFPLLVLLFVDQD